MYQPRSFFKAPYWLPSICFLCGVTWTSVSQAMGKDQGWGNCPSHWAGPWRVGDLPFSTQHPKGSGQLGLPWPHSHLRRSVWGPALKQGSVGSEILAQMGPSSAWVIFWGTRTVALAGAERDRAQLPPPSDRTWKI